MPLPAARTNGRTGAAADPESQLINIICVSLTNWFTQGFFGGRPRPRLRETTAPCSKISPPQTPQGSPRSRAPAKQAERIGQLMHNCLARSSSAGDSENQRSASPVWHGNHTPGGASVPGSNSQAGSSDDPLPRGRVVVVDKACLLTFAGSLVVVRYGCGSLDRPDTRTKRGPRIRWWFRGPRKPCTPACSVRDLDRL